MSKLIRFLFGLRTEFKQLIVVVNDIIILFFSLWSSLSLRYEKFNYPFDETIYFYCFIIILAVPIFSFFDLYRNVHRYTDFYYINQVIKAFILYLLIFVIGFISYKFYFEVKYLERVFIPFSIIIIQPVMLFVLLLLSRMTYKFILNQDPNIKINLNVRNILIYGADKDAVKIGTIINSNPKYKLLAYIDADKKFYKRTINTIKVYRPEDITKLKNKFNVSDIILGITHDDERKKEIIKNLQNYNLHIRKFSNLVESSEGSKFEIEDLSIDELLGRDVVKNDNNLLKKNIKGKNILISGAGGSIGSEIAREVVKLNPNRLILFELNEYSLYNVEKELASIKNSNQIETTILPILGNICDQNYLEHIIRENKVNSIFHAAAYKHVNLVEKNPLAGIKNNIFGTLSICMAAMKGKVDSFTLVSTDKAVNPKNIMGKTKRVSEIILKSLSENTENNLTTFSMVRFGNVLNSTGSVVPLFRNQIKDGGPITLTHRDVTRYFMTINEAALLVIQAGAMAKCGQLFILNMGKPIKIIDLAKRMINLSGLQIKDNENPTGDIEIKIIGLSKGEKLHEKLIYNNNISKTIHPKIFSTSDFHLKWNILETHLHSLETYLLKGELTKCIEEIEMIIK